MSDHLSNLVGRTLGTTPVIRPRVASRYAGTPNPQPEPVSPSTPLPAAPHQQAALLQLSHEIHEPAPTLPEPALLVNPAALDNNARPVHPASVRVAASAASPAGSQASVPAGEAVAPEALHLLLPLQPSASISHQQPGAPVPAASAPPAQPIIRVHIGSIEVRAVHQAEEPRRPQPATPAARPVSLDAYLERKRGSR